MLIELVTASVLDGQYSTGQYIATTGDCGGDRARADHTKLPPKLSSNKRQSGALRPIALDWQADLSFFLSVCVCVWVCVCVLVCRSVCLFVCPWLSPTAAAALAATMAAVPFSSN